MKRTRLDPDYFCTRSWARRLKDSLSRLQGDRRSVPFLDGHVRVVRNLLLDGDGGPRVVVNIGADALLSFLAADHKERLADPDWENIPCKPVFANATLRCLRSLLFKSASQFGFNAEDSKVLNFGIRVERRTGSIGGVY